MPSQGTRRCIPLLPLYTSLFYLCHDMLSFAIFPRPFFLVIFLSPLCSTTFPVTHLPGSCTWACLWSPYLAGLRRALGFTWPSNPFTGAVGRGRPARARVGPVTVIAALCKLSKFGEIWFVFGLSLCLHLKILQTSVECWHLGLWIEDLFSPRWGTHILLLVPRCHGDLSTCRRRPSWYQVPKGR